MDISGGLCVDDVLTGGNSVEELEGKWLWPGLPAKL